MTRIHPLLLALTLLATPISALPSAGAVRPRMMPWSDVVVLDRFDPALGTLRAVRLTYDTYAEGVAGLENTQSGPTSLGMAFTTRIRLARPNGEPLVHTDHSADYQAYLGGFDGSIDYGGTSGVRPLLSGSHRQVITIDDPVGLWCFQGAIGDPGTVELPVAATGTCAVECSSVLSGRAAMRAGVRVRAEFVYDLP